MLLVRESLTSWFSTMSADPPGTKLSAGRATEEEMVEVDPEGAGNRGMRWVAV